MSRIKDETMDYEDGEVYEASDPNREPTSPPPRRYRSRSRSVDIELVPNFVPNQEIENAQVQLQEIFKEYKDSETGCEYVTTFYSKEEKDVDLKPLETTKKYASYIRNCVDAIDKNRSLVFAANDPIGKQNINTFTIEKCAADERLVYFVVRNEIVGRRRYYQLSAEFANVAILSLTRGKKSKTKGFLYVVTIDVLRLLLYHGVNFGSNVMIFDDCEYMCNTEFGYMYEEAMAMLDWAQLILFFPKISNYSQIARWICSISQRSVESVYVSISNTSLKQFICYYNDGKAGTMKQVIDSQGNFNESALEVPTPESAAHVVIKDYKDIDQKLKPTIYQLQDSLVRIVRTARSLNCTPILIYCHDTDSVERYANMMGNFNFNTGGSCKHSAMPEDDVENDEIKVLRHVKMVIEALDEKDKRSLLTKAVKEFAVRGIGIYHAGMVPILKELTEQLFADKLLKVVVADETLLWETNLIFKTIIIYEPKILVQTGFTRWMNGEEFQKVIQRTYGENKNDPALVVVVPVLPIPIDIAKEYFLPETPSIKSEFKHTPISVLNLYREGISMNQSYLERRLFTSFQRKEESAEIRDKLRNENNLLKSIIIRDEEELENYDDRVKKLKKEEDLIYAQFAKFDEIKPFMRNGRVVKVCYNNLDFGYGVILQKETKEKEKIGTKVTVAVRTTVESYETEERSLLRPAIEGQPETMAALNLTIAEHILRVSSYRLKLPINMNFEQFKEWVMWCLKEEASIAGQFPDLDPVNDIKIKDKSFIEKWKIFQELKGRLEKLKNSIGNDTFDEKWKKYQEKKQLAEQVQKLTDVYESPSLMDLKEQFNDMKKFLKSLDFIDENNKLTGKGLFAAHLRSQHPILITEFIFSPFAEGSEFASDFMTSLALLIEMKGYSTRKPNFPTMSDKAKKLIELYTAQWHDITYENIKNLKRNLIQPNLMIAINELCQKYLPFEELYKVMNLSVIEGYLATALVKFDKLLGEVYGFRHYLPENYYSEEFWKDFKKLRETRIQKSMALTTIANDYIKFEKL